VGVVLLMSAAQEMRTPLRGRKRKRKRKRRRRRMMWGRWRWRGPQSADRHSMWWWRSSRSRRRRRKKRLRETTRMVRVVFWNREGCYSVEKAATAMTNVLFLAVVIVAVSVFLNFQYYCY
jgi:hypothetical protein